METLGDALPRETARVRALIPMYRSIGPAGNFAIMMMEQALQKADKAMIAGDFPSIIAVYQELKEFHE